jgi:hypothetical protein
MASGEYCRGLVVSVMSLQQREDEDGESRGAGDQRVF